MSQYAPLLISLAVLCSVGAVAHRTTPPAPPTLSTRTVVAGVVGYPVAIVSLLVLGTNYLNFISGVLLLGLAALALGTAIPRLWTALIPLAVAAVPLGLGYLGDPSCSNCGEGTWPYAIASALFFFVAPSMLMVELGILARNLLARRSRPSATR